MATRRYSTIFLILTTAGLLTASLFFVLSGTPPVARAALAPLFVAPRGDLGTCSQANPCTLAAAMAAAVDGDDIYLAAGNSGHGFCLGPITGRLLAEWIVDGAPSMDLSAVRWTRFDDIYL